MKLANESIVVMKDGFIRVIDMMGDDTSIVQAARVSYGSGTKSKSQDGELIRYLMRHRHTSPFEMCEIKLHVRVPMDCWRQWIRHRTANVNEYSTRYTVAIDTMATTEPDQWRLQAHSNRQGSEGSLDMETGRIMSDEEQRIQKECRKVYEDRLKTGIAREQARKDLPLSTYTEAYWKIDLHNLLHFLELRMAPNAQYEIRQYANVIGYEIVSKWVPVTWQAFLDYRLNALHFSSIELDLLKDFSNGQTQSAIDVMVKMGLLKGKGEILTPNLEAQEFGVKLERLGINKPWES